MMQLKIREFSQGDLGLYMSYRRAFDVAIRELGIVNRDTVVNLFVKPPNKPEFVREEGLELFGHKIPFTRAVVLSVMEGATAPALNPDGSIDVMLYPRLGTHAGARMQTFMHEMTHVAQILNGRLTGDQKSGSVWEGQFFSDEEMEKLGHDGLPWEQEADRKAKELMKGPVTDDIKSFSAQLAATDREGIKRILQEAVFGGIGGPLRAAFGPKDQMG